MALQNGDLSLKKQKYYFLSGSSIHEKQHHKLISEREGIFRNTVSNLKQDLKTLQNIHHDLRNAAYQREKEYNKTIVRLQEDINIIENNHMELLKAFEIHQTECNETVSSLKQKIANMTDALESQKETMQSLRQKLASTSLGGGLFQNTEQMCLVLCMLYISLYLSN